MRALPGGLDVLGFYVVAPSDYTTKNQTSLRQVSNFVFYWILHARGCQLVCS